MYFRYQVLEPKSYFPPLRLYKNKVLILVAISAFRLFTLLFVDCLAIHNLQNPHPNDN